MKRYMKHLGKYVIFFFVILLFVLSSSYLQSIEPEASDNAILSGYVIDKESKETIVGAMIYLESTKIGAYTNKSGYFSLSIPPGEYNVIISYLGYEKIKQKLKFKKNESIRKNFELTPTKVTTDEVFVDAEREVEKREISISKINIPIDQIKKIRIGGEADVFRSLQFLPGILTSSQLSSGLFVRGGSPDQNLVLLDGSTVYNPSHLFGFISTFNTDAIKDVELIKGGFPAEYGGRLSAVLNITQKDGNREKVEGSASIGVISSKATLEGPLGRGSWFISGRRTYFELIKAFLPEDKESPLPDFNFYDLNAKISQDIGDNDKVFLSGFMSSDAMGYASYGMSMDLSIANRLLSARWTHIFGDNLFSTINFNTSYYLNRFKGDQSGYEFLIENSIMDNTAKGTLEWFVSDKLTSKFGIEITNYIFNFLQNFSGETDSTQSGSTGGKVNIEAQEWIYSSYGQLNYMVTDLLSLQAGLRGSYWKLSDKFLFDPRLAVRYQFQDNIAIKAAWGIFHQNLRLASMQDFSFFDTWLPTDSTIAPSEAMHYILSLETSPAEGYDLNFDIYYKKMSNINELNMNAMQGETVSDIFYVGNGDAYGAEVFLQKKFGKFSGWIGYALGFITARFDSVNYGKEFRPKYDRRHDFKVVAQYELDESWQFGATFTFQSGQSYTGATSRYQSLLPGENYGRGKIIPSQRYGLRLPPSHQLNLSASYSFKTFGLPSKLTLDIYNVYNRRDIWFRYYNTRDVVTTVEDVRLIPILPTISYEIKF